MKKQSLTKPVSTSSNPTLYELEVWITQGLITEEFAKKNPVIARTIQIRSDQTLEDLHNAIFEAYDRFDAHMYEFQLGGEGPMDPKARRYVLPETLHDDFGDPDQKPVASVDQTTLGSLGLKVEDTFAYWFDFGDDWWHSISLKAIHDHVPPGSYPKVTQRTGESPPQYVDWEEEEKKAKKQKKKRKK